MGSEKLLDWASQLSAGSTPAPTQHVLEGARSSDVRVGGGGREGF